MPVWLAKLAIPKWLWWALGGLAVAALALFLHSRAVSKFGKEQFDKGVKHNQARIEKKVKAIAVAAEKVALDAQELSRKDFRRINTSARTLLVRGPGKAACSPTVPIPARQPDRSNPGGSSPVDAVPDGQGQQLIGVPFTGAITLAENHDLCWAREKAWRKWHNDLSEIWRKSN